ncbi:MAG: lycopene cyclase family protein, partial [Sphingomonadales bacterium]
AIPEQRVEIFERFYRLPEGLIERFYSGRSGMTDKARILIGRPPVPIARAIKALAGSGRPLLDGKSA